MLRICASRQVVLLCCLMPYYNVLPRCSTLLAARLRAARTDVGTAHVPGCWNCVDFLLSSAVAAAGQTDLLFGEAMVLLL